MKTLLKRGVLVLMASAVAIAATATTASAIVVFPTNTFFDSTLTFGTTSSFTVPSVITIRCDTHTFVGLTDVMGDTILVSLATNTYANGAASRCSTDQRGVEAIVSVLRNWTLTATRTTGGTIFFPTGAVNVQLSGIFGCNSQFQSSTVGFTYDNRGRLQTNPLNSVATRGDRGLCIFPTAMTVQETWTFDTALVFV